MTKIRALLAAALLVVATLGLSASPAQALSGNYVRNAVQPSNYAIAISTNNPYVFAYNIWPYQTSGNMWCFKPALTSHSAWGGIYWGGQVRCFTTAGNGTLVLYSGMP